MTREERRIQKVLGLETPPTLIRRIKLWWWQTINIRIFFQDELWRWFAFKLPEKLVYHTIICSWAHATSCAEGRNECADKITVSNAIDRWEHSK